MHLTLTAVTAILLKWLMVTVPIVLQYLMAVMDSGSMNDKIKQLALKNYLDKMEPHGPIKIVNMVQCILKHGL